MHKSRGDGLRANSRRFPPRLGQRKTWTSNCDGASATALATAAAHRTISDLTKCFEHEHSTSTTSFEYGSGLLRVAVYYVPLRSTGHTANRCGQLDCFPWAKHFYTMLAIQERSDASGALLKREAKFSTLQRDLQHLLLPTRG